MTRKDFELIARTIKAMPTFAPSLRTCKRSTAIAFADALVGEADGRFDKPRFLVACGLTATGVETDGGVSAAVDA